MRVPDILNSLASAGVTVEVDGNELVLRPGNKVPRDIIPDLRAHKPEIMNHLRRKEILNLRGRYQFRNSETGHDQAEWDEIQLEVDTHGRVLLWSEVPNDYIGVYATEDDRHKIPPEFIPYSSEELKHIFGDGKPAVAESTIRLLHKAKMLGATITDSYPAGETNNDNTA